MEEPGQRGTNEDAEGGSEDQEGQDERERTNGAPDYVSTGDGDTIGEAAPGEDLLEDGERLGAEAAEREGLQRRLEAKDRHIKELYDELTAVRLTADETGAKAEAGELRMRDLEEERERLREQLRELEDEERRRRRWREGQDRRVARLEREIERREERIRGLEDLLEERDVYDREAQSIAARKDAALEDALRRVEGLERDLEEREEVAAELRAVAERMRAEMNLEHELQRRMAEPANRLRAGIDLFNGSEQLQEIGSISRSLGQPEVHVALEATGGAEPPVVLTFTWAGVTWRTYAANPGFAVEEPRVYRTGSGEDLSGVDHEPSNAHVGPGGRVVLGL